MKDNKSIVAIVIAIIALVAVITSVLIGITNISKKSNGNLDTRLSSLETKVTDLEKIKKEEEQKQKEINAKNTANLSSDKLNKNPETILLVTEVFSNMNKIYEQSPDIFSQNGQVSLQKIEEVFRQYEKVKNFETKGTFTFNVANGNIEVVFLPITGSDLNPETFVVSILENTFTVKLKEKTGANINEIAIVNNKFLPYHGTIPGTTLKLLVKVWQEHIAKLEKDGAGPEKFIGAKIIEGRRADELSSQLGTNFMYSQETKNPNLTSLKISELTSYIRDLAKYNITFDYFSDGLITEINIEPV